MGLNETFVEKLDAFGITHEGLLILNTIVSSVYTRTISFVSITKRFDCELDYASAIT